MDRYALRTNKLNLYYGDFHALKNVDFQVHSKAITALIGPSGCGKSTLLRCFNRMNDLLEEVRIEGDIYVHDETGRHRHHQLPGRRWAWSFSAPTPFPSPSTRTWSGGLFKVHGMGHRRGWREIVDRCLHSVGLLDELKDKLHTPRPLELSEEIKQRLCVARLLTVEPEIILLDEPCSALDPIATMRIEELMIELKERYTILIVTHNMQQAARVSDYTGFMLLGDLVEFGETSHIFTSPRDERTEGYITGRYG